jgi:hypothetical protein
MGDSTIFFDFLAAVAADEDMMIAYIVC